MLTETRGCFLYENVIVIRHITTNVGIKAKCGIQTKCARLTGHMCQGNPTKVVSDLSMDPISTTDSDKLQNGLYFICNDAGTPKRYNENCPLRLTTALQNGPTYNLGKYLYFRLHHPTEKSLFSVCNLSQVINCIYKPQLQDDEVMPFFDITILNTSTLINLAHTLLAPKYCTTDVLCRNTWILLTMTLWICCNFASRHNSNSTTNSFGALVVLQWIQYAVFRRKTYRRYPTIILDSVYYWT